MASRRWVSWAFAEVLELMRVKGTDMIVRSDRWHTDSTPL